MGDGQDTLPFTEQNETADLLSAKARALRMRVRNRELVAPPPIAPMIGRYRLLEVVGTGGMGLVWGAWDPELERRVAIKLLRHTTARSRERMLREGQALARLSHPNVVPIFDVGEIGEQVYLVMEWIRGTTLTTFAKQRPSGRELLEAYRQAGAGLAAAHEAGVVHRDFKPDNAIRGEDGRVRVLDFGIAHDVSTAEAVVAAGTPRYTAPEQLRGDPVTPACDQYAFCISLRDASDELPAWIAEIVARGSDPDPANRFESMTALLDALDRDPSRHWKRAAMGVFVVGAALGAFAIGRTVTSPNVETCSGIPEELSAGPRDRMRVHLRALGQVAVADDLDRYAATWVDVRTRACHAYERKELTQPLYDARLACFAQTRSQLAATTELLANVSATDLPNALLAARSLPDVRGCADIASTVAPPPAHVAAQLPTIVPKMERALVLATARDASAAGEAKAMTAVARTTRYEPLIARALLIEGRAVAIEGDARNEFSEAMLHALRASDDALAVEAYARWIFEVARADPGATIDGWVAMEALAERLGNAGKFARALMYNNRAVAFLGENNKRDARAFLDRALAIADDLEDLELLAIRQNLLQLESDPAAYERGVRALHDRLAAVLGPDHPDVLLHRVPLALMAQDLAQARRDLEATCQGFARWQQLATTRLCKFEAALLADEAGDRPAAVNLMANVGGDDLHAAIANAYITGEATHLKDMLRELPDSWWNRLAAADAWAVLGDWPRAYALLQQVDRPMYARRLARARRMVTGTESR